MRLGNVTKLTGSGLGVNPSRGKTAAALRIVKVLCYQNEHKVRVGRLGLTLPLWASL